jgi:hypothetical protein
MYNAFLGVLFALLDGSLDSNKYEDAVRQVIFVKKICLFRCIQGGLFSLDKRHFVCVCVCVCVCAVAGQSGVRAFVA